MDVGVVIGITLTIGPQRRYGHPRGTNQTGIQRLIKAHRDRHILENSLSFRGGGAGDHGTKAVFHQLEIQGVGQGTVATGVGDSCLYLNIGSPVGDRRRKIIKVKGKRQIAGDGGAIHQQIHLAHLNIFGDADINGKITAVNHLNTRFVGQHIPHGGADLTHGRNPSSIRWQITKDFETEVAVCHKAEALGDRHILGVIVSGIKLGQQGIGHSRIVQIHHPHATIQGRQQAQSRTVQRQIAGTERTIGGA